MVLFSTVTREAELLVSLSTGMTVGRSARSIAMARRGTDSGGEGRRRGEAVDG